MRFDDDSARLSPEERRAAVAAILALGVLRLQKRAALSTDAPEPENPSVSSQNRLEAVPENPLTVHVG